MNTETPRSEEAYFPVNATKHSMYEAMQRLERENAVLRKAVDAMVATLTVKAEERAIAIGNALVAAFDAIIYMNEGAVSNGH